ncbi:MAG: HDOD domain-containing protein [Burkholderiales bacterium]|nr:HDOD domain-containing protein [Burkholderiales bacterium]
MPTPPHLGRFELHQMLGRSLAASSWLAIDPRLEKEVLLCVPRVQPHDSQALNDWTQNVQAAARLVHPRLAPVQEVVSKDNWPVVSYRRDTHVTLAERLSAGSPPTVDEIAAWMVDVLDGLAYAHEAGVAHRDLGVHTVLIDTNGRASVAGLGVGLMAYVPGTPQGGTVRQQQREAAERDVLMAGLLMHQLLAGQPALDDPDLGRAAQRVGREIVRLPWSAAQPVPDTLRAIVNRATDRQQRQRYLNARTLLAALQGWITASEQESGGPLVLLLDRLDTVGILPHRPQAERSLNQLLNQETLRVDDIVDVIVKDPGLVWELLRSVNTARFQNGASDDHVSTITRAIVLLGHQNLRKVAGSLRPWPGVLAAATAHATGIPADGSQSALEAELRRACLAGHMARLLAPFAINDEEALVSAMSQCLGPLLVRYHFPDEARQIDRLMQPGPPPAPDSPPAPGMTMAAAAAAVLGIDMTELSVAVMRHWGLDEKLQQAARPLNKTLPVRRPDDALEMMRAVASLANELVAAVSVGSARRQALLQQCFARYARALNVTLQECQEALETSLRLIDFPASADSFSF